MSGDSSVDPAYLWLTIVLEGVQVEAGERVLAVITVLAIVKPKVKTVLLVIVVLVIGGAIVAGVM